MKKKSIKVEVMSKQRITMRIHWLPVFVNDDYIHHWFEQYGQILSIEKEYDSELLLQTSIRRVKMVVSEEAMLRIPHLISYGTGPRLWLPCLGENHFA